MAKPTNNALRNPKKKVSTSTSCGRCVATRRPKFIPYKQWKHTFGALVDTTRKKYLEVHWVNNAQKTILIVSLLFK